MRNMANYYRAMMQQSLALRLTILLILFSFPLSIVFTIVCLCLHCSYSSFYYTCSYLIYSNPYQCAANGVTMCCGYQGILACQGYQNCIVKPSMSNQSLCKGMVITSWVLYFVFLISTILFFILHRRAAPQLTEDYARLNQDIEIANQRSNGNLQRPPNNQPFSGQGQIIGSDSNNNNSVPSFPGQGEQIGNSLL